MPDVLFHDLQTFSKEIGNAFKERYQKLNIQKNEEEVASLNKQLESEDFWKDNDSTQQIEDIKKIQTKISYLEKKYSPWLTFKKELIYFQEYLEITILENETFLIENLNHQKQDLEKKFNKLDLASLLTEQEDSNNAFLNIHPGAGGTESQDWADMLYRAYMKWTEKKNYLTECVDYQNGDEAGIKNVTIRVIGFNAFGFLKAENGIHRLVRISPFDTNKKRHTSFASVHVSPELDDNIDIEVLDKDLRIDTYRASGAGGQHVNKTDSAVRITHIATNLVVACQNERSQMKNKSTAMKILKARLYELEKAKKNEEINKKSGERKDISWGNQIRSYVFHPYNLVKDLRTNYETSNIQDVMNGSFDPFIDAYLRHL